MAQVSLDDAKKVTERIVTELHPRAVILFGSVAKKGYGEDLDLLIIHEEQKSNWESYQEVQKIIGNFYKYFDIDCLVTSTSQVKKLFLQGSPFLRLIQREGKSLYMKDSVKEWFQHAQEDLAMACWLWQGKYYRGVCYNAQQAIEKAMKGFLIEKGWDLVKTHSLKRLIAIGKDYKIDFQVPEEMVLLLDSLVSARYPGEEGLLPTGELTKEQAYSILAAVKQFFILHKLQTLES